MASHANDTGAGVLTFLGSPRKGGNGTSSQEVSKKEGANERRRRGSFTTVQADSAEVPVDEPPLRGARHGALQRVDTRAVGPLDSTEALELMESFADEQEGACASEDEGGRPRRPSMFDVFRDLLPVNGDNSMPMREIPPRKTLIFDTKDLVHQRELYGSLGTTTQASLKQLQDEPRLSPGEAAYLLHHKALRAANNSKIEQRTYAGKVISPISRNYEFVKGEITFVMAKKIKEAANTRAMPAGRLSEWFDAGLQRTASGVQGRRPLPEGYDRALWATEAVPLIRHEKTGTIIWPVRLDLVPLYAEVEGKHTGQIGEAEATTVFHFTSSGGFQRIVAPPLNFLDDAEADEHMYAEEVWDRLEEDVHHLSVPPVEGAPEFSLLLMGSDPSRFDSREAVASALYRTSQSRIGHGKIGHCVALQVPTDRCMAVAGRHNTHVVVVVPPGVDEGYEIEEEDKSSRPGLVRWKIRGALKGNRKYASVAAQAKSMNLLDGLIDRETGEFLAKGVLSNPQGEPGSTRGAPGSPRGAPNSLRMFSVAVKALKSAEGDGVQRELTAGAGREGDSAQLRLKLERLTEDQRLLERKIRHAERSQEKQEAGKASKFLATDQHRLEKLQQRLARCLLQQQEVHRKLASRDEIFSEAVNHPRQDPTTYAAHEALETRTKEAVTDVGEEYQVSSGDVFREVFGGNIEGVKAWLQDPENDVNLIHTSTGWSPLHMATSMGDPEMVKLVLKHSGSPHQSTREHGWAPVHFAVMKSSVEVLQLLLDADEDCVHFKTKDAQTALFVAVKSSPARVRDEMIRILIENNSDPNVKQSEGWTPLSLAVVRNYAAMVRLMVQNRGYVFDECPKEQGKNIWQVAAQHVGLQATIRANLNSRDLRIIEKRDQRAM